MLAHFLQHGNWPRRLQGLTCMIYYFVPLNVVGLVVWPTRGMVPPHMVCHIDVNLPASKNSILAFRQSQMRGKMMADLPRW